MTVLLVLVPVLLVLVPVFTDFRTRFTEYGPQIDLRIDPIWTSHMPQLLPVQEYPFQS